MRRIRVAGSVSITMDAWQFTELGILHEIEGYTVNTVEAAHRTFADSCCLVDSCRANCLCLVVIHIKPTVEDLACIEHKNSETLETTKSFTRLFVNMNCSKAKKNVNPLLIPPDISTINQIERWGQTFSTQFLCRLKAYQSFGHLIKNECADYIITLFTNQRSNKIVDEFRRTPVVTNVEGWYGKEGPVASPVSAAASEISWTPQVHVLCPASVIRKRIMIREISMLLLWTKHSCEALYRTTWSACRYVWPYTWPVWPRNSCHHKEMLDCLNV